MEEKERRKESPDTSPDNYSIISSCHRGPPVQVGHAGPLEEARVGGEKERVREGTAEGVCVCERVHECEWKGVEGCECVCAGGGGVQNGNL